MTTIHEHSPCRICDAKGYVCYPSTGVATCPGEECASCDYAVPDRTDWKALYEAERAAREEAANPDGDCTEAEMRICERTLADAARIVREDQPGEDT